jgi:hypothetical protein
MPADLALSYAEIRADSQRRLAGLHAVAAAQGAYLSQQLGLTAGQDLMLTNGRVRWPRFRLYFIDSCQMLVLSSSIALTEDFLALLERYEGRVRVSGALHHLSELGLLNLAEGEVATESSDLLMRVVSLAGLDEQRGVDRRW